ncbi:Putative transferase CAF17-like, mitochondrial [Papilio xuthus]|uniref:Putative transferase CAF17-like, mitochondrial n=1 Tax=Papilio xuthus TaxID=66420 RepID=A0A194PGI7_PAPXU|nr:Putative transferase CAF17-like, mitochondrial [Papilio xuthus]
MRHFEEGAKSMYAMFLNNKGRVMYDTLVYKWKDDDSYLLECDSSVINAIQKHLKMFKLRRQLDIKDVNDEIKLWALISPNVPDIVDNTLEIYKDPRLNDLGSRIISSVSVNETKITDIIGSDITIVNDDNGYKYLRYKLGVSEGADDLPPGTSFPLEANCDYLHGVSFHKGCYIGQELTARVHHTGVVRKRLMPLKFTADVKDSIQKDCPITFANNTKTSVGKLKGTTQNYGLGLLRIKEAMDAKILKVGDYEAEVIKPSWWPIEAPREVTAKKEQN